MRGRPMPRSATWGTVIVRARREPPPGRQSSCRTSIGSLATSRLGSPAPTTASATTTSRCTSTSSPSASTAGGPRWPPSRPSSVSPPASTARRPTTCCTVRSQPDRQKPCLRRCPLELSRRLLPNEPTKSHQSDDPVIYCWADYERPFVERLWERHGANSKGYAILRGNLVDQCAFVQSHFAMPTHSYSIKAIAPLFGFGWQVDAASGLNSEAWYAEWLATGEERILQKILRYNLDD